MNYFGSKYCKVIDISRGFILWISALLNNKTFVFFSYWFVALDSLRFLSLWQQKESEIVFIYDRSTISDSRKYIKIVAEDKITVAFTTKLCNFRCCGINVKLMEKMCQNNNNLSFIHIFGMFKRIKLHVFYVFFVMDHFSNVYPNTNLIITNTFAEIRPQPFEKNF